MVVQGGGKTGMGEITSNPSRWGRTGKNPGQQKEHLWKRRGYITHEHLGSNGLLVVTLPLLNRYEGGS